MRSSASLCATLAVCCGSNAAEAHFLFARICPAAEGGRVAEVYFSEYAHGGEPRYIAKMAGGKYWLQAAAGEFRPWEVRALSGRLRGRLPVEGSLMVVGRVDYGVLSGSPGGSPGRASYCGIIPRPWPENRRRSIDSPRREQMSRSWPLSSRTVS